MSLRLGVTFLRDPRGLCNCRLVFYFRQCLLVVRVPLFSTAFSLAVSHTVVSHEVLSGIYPVGQSPHFL